MEIYFVDAHHKRNYGALLVKFPQAKTQGDYRAACYIAAHPEIFKCFNAFKQKNGPFGWYMEYLEDPDAFIERRDKGETTGDTAPLTGQTRKLVNIGLHLFNSDNKADADFAAVMDLQPDLYLVVLQALDLVRRQPSIDYTELAEDIVGKLPWWER